MVMITNSFDKFPNEPTALMYEQFGKIGLNPSTVTFEDDFSTSPNGWTSVGSTVTISSGALRAVSVNTASDDRLHKGLGFTLSNSAWVCQFEVNLSTSNYTNLIALTDRVSNMNAYDTILCDYNGSNIKMREYNGSTLGLDSTGIAVSTGTQYYITLTRTGETGLKLDVRTGSHTGTVVGSQTGTISSGTVDLDTVQSGAYGRESGSASYVIDNLKIYNGVTSTTSPKVKQHFIEWFSGKQIPSYWTLQNNSALPTVAMQDSVGGGLLMTNTGTGYGGSITFNNKRHYGGSSNCTCIMVLKNTTLNGITYAGFDRNGAPSTSNGGMGPPNSTAVIEMGASTYFSLVVTDAGTGWDRTATSIPTADSNWHNVKIDVKASDVDLTVDGTLEATRTGVRPSTTMQPSITGRNTGANATTHIRYMECYNT